MKSLIGQAPFRKDSGRLISVRENCAYIGLLWTTSADTFSEMANDQVKDVVGANLRRIRGAMTLAELSSRLAELGQPIGISTLSKIERGDRRISVDDLVALATAVDVEPSMLLARPTDAATTLRRLLERLAAQMDAVHQADADVHRLREELDRLLVRQLDAKATADAIADDITSVLGKNPHALEHLSASERSQVWQITGAREGGR